MGLERNSGYRLPQNIRELTKDVKISGQLGKETMQTISMGLCATQALVLVLPKYL